MPMLLDSNQLAKQIAGAENCVGSGNSYAKNGTTRYNQNPLEKHADVVYKRFGTSGDFKLDREVLLQPLNPQTKDIAGATIFRQGNATTGTEFFNGMNVQYLDKANSHIGAPSYRMSMALACFLKDGTYSLNDGVIIPYSYDSRRYIGGTQTTSLYAVWHGVAGYGDARGLIYYQAGVVVLPATLTAAGGAATTAEWVPDGSHRDDIMKTGSMDQYSDGFIHRIKNISFNNTTELNSTIYFCRANHNEFNYSSNPTYLTGSKIRVKADDLMMPPRSYATTIGLYSADNELLAVAKLSEPLRKDPTNELTLRVRLDY